MSVEVVGPLALCRLDASLIERIKRREALGPLLIESTLWLVLGAALYGAVFGGWRSPLQGLYAAIKLPVLFVALVLSTASANAAFTLLAGARLDPRQVLCCSVLSLAVLGILLGSLVPISLLMTFSVEQFGDRFVGESSVNAWIAIRDAERLLSYHVVLIGSAGVLAMIRLRRLFDALIEDPRVSKNAFWLCLGVQALAGTQLSWILRPYLGKPHIPVEFLRADAFSGSFLEEVGRLLGMS